MSALRALLTHTPQARENYYGDEALAGQALETVGQVRCILRGEVPDGAVNAASRTRRALLGNEPARGAERIPQAGLAALLQAALQAPELLVFRVQLQRAPQLRPGAIVVAALPGLAGRVDAALQLASWRGRGRRRRR